MTWNEIGWEGKQKMKNAPEADFAKKNFTGQGR
jgi:hypothetical protein